MKEFIHWGAVTLVLISSAEEFLSGVNMLMAGRWITAAANFLMMGGYQYAVWYLVSERFK